MTIARFEVLAKVIDLGSFTKASEQLNMTQSAVSHAIASLEAEWGVTLLIRDRRKGLIVTEIGQKTLIHIREILKRTEIIHQEVSLAVNAEAGSIRIGTFTSASSCLLPKIIAKFQKKHPNIELSFFEGTYEEIEEWLETGVIDIGFVVQQDEQASPDTLPLIQDQMVVAFSKDHTFANQAVIHVEQLADEPFIMPKGMYQSHVKEIFGQAGISPSIRFEVLDCHTIANMVQEGLGITIGPELFLKTQQGIQIGQLNVLNWRSVALACNSVSDASPAVLSFIAAAKHVFPNPA